MSNFAIDRQSIDDCRSMDDNLSHGARVASNVPELFGRISRTYLTLDLYIFVSFRCIVLSDKYGLLDSD